MAGITRVGDKAGGTIIGEVAKGVYVNGKAIACVGAAITPHGDDRHKWSPKMVEGSGSVFASGKAVCRAGDSASCGHSASGSGNVFAG